MIKQIFSKMGWRSNKSHSVVSEKFPDSHPGDSVHSSVVPLRSNSMIAKKRDSAEVFNDAVEKLVGKLESINQNLESQVEQNQRLVERMDALPGMLMPLPKAVEEQRRAFAQVAEQLRQKVARDEKVVEELSGIHEKVSQSVEVDAKMYDSFNMFSETLSKLDDDTISQTQWIQQMSRTFSASERYIKHAITKQQTRFYWVFGISLGICFFAIVALMTAIILLRGN